MFKETFKRGFTLIELLVVIAIIGILASVILASLATARDKGVNAAIQTSVNNVRDEAELYGDKPDGSVDYTNLCTSDTKVVQIKTDITAKTSAPACAADKTSWVFSGPLKMNPIEYSCVDSSGTATTTTKAANTTTSPYSC